MLERWCRSAEALSRCSNQFPLHKFDSFRCILSLSHFKIEIKLLFYCLSWWNKFPTSNLVRVNLNAYTGFFFLSVLFLDHICSTKSHSQSHYLWNKIQITKNLLINIAAQNTQLGFFISPMSTRSTNLTNIRFISNLLLKFTGMKSIANLSLNKFAWWSFDDLCWFARRTVSIFSSFLLARDRPHRAWCSTDMSPFLKQEKKTLTDLFYPQRGP